MKSDHEKFFIDTVA